MRRRFRFAPLIDHLIGGRQHRFRDGKADQTPFGVRANAATRARFHRRRRVACLSVRSCGCTAVKIRLPLPHDAGVRPDEQDRAID
jgi:hypothetical protein